MKKGILYYFTIFTLLLSSCQDFLKEESKSQMTENFYETNQGLYEGVAAVYTVCRELYQHHMFRMDYYGDLMENASSMNNSYDQAANVSWDSPNSIFANIHKGVMIVNRLESIIGENPEERVKEIYLAELRFLRAHFYQIQVEFWGRYGHYQEKVYTEYDPEMLNINQKSVEFFYTNILEDINYAISKLPPKAEVSEIGRASQGAAKALKARHLLAIAGYSHSEYSGQPEHNLYSILGYSSLEALYTEAKSLSQSVINDYGYRMEDEYSKVFDAYNKTSDEVIWAVQWTTDKMFNDPPSYIHRPAVGRTSETLILHENSDGTTSVSTQQLVVTRLNEVGNAFNYVMPSHSMYYGREYRHVMPSFHWIMMYDENDKRREANFETLYLKIDDDKEAPANMTDTVCYMPLRMVTPEEDQRHRNWVASGDPKAYFIDGLNEVYDMDDPDSEYYGGPLKHRSRYYSVKKFYDRSRTEMGKQEEGNANSIIIRLPEMYLIVAECNWKLNLGDESVYDALSPVWERAFDDVNDADVYRQTSIDVDFIIDEYQRELGMEHNNFNLLKRNRKLVDRIKKNNPKSREETADNVQRWRDYVTDNHYIKPLPLSQINNFRNITQDMLPPGYDYGSL